MNAKQHEQFLACEAGLGDLIRHLRMERGWSQLDLSQRLGDLGWPLHQTNISKLEAGRRPIRIAEAEALAMALRIPLEALWYMPVPGEPESIHEQREQLKGADEQIRDIEDSLRAVLSDYAEALLERARLTRVIHETAREAQ